MARNCVFLVLILCTTLVCDAAIFHPISDSHRSAALEIFAPVDGSFGSLEEAYEALRTFEILGIGKELNIRVSACPSVVDTLGSSSSSLKDLFYALRVNVALKCEISEEVFAGTASRCKASVHDAKSLFDFYYSIGSLRLIKDQTSEVDVLLSDADGIFQAIKALSQSDGRWRYSSNNPASSTYAAGVALQTLAGVVSLATSEIDQSLIGMLQNDIVKLFDGIEKYDDGAFYFDEKLVDALGHQGPLSATSSVVRGLTAFAAATSGSLNLPGDKILGLANFFLAIGIPGSAKDFYDQIDALACLESNRVSIPLILSLPATVLSLTRKDQLKVRVTTVLGSTAPHLSVKLVQAFSSGSKGASIVESQELKFDPENDVHFLDALPKSVDLGTYHFVFEIVLHDSDEKNIYATGSRTKVPIYVTGVIKVDNAEIAVLDSDLGSIETQKKLDLAGETALSLSANHLQKLRLSFQLTTPLGHSFKPHQAFLKLRHETQVEHIFVLGNSGKQFKIILDFLGLVEKFFYLSGRYDIQLTVGDAVMENSYLRELGSIELDLPEPPEKATRPPPQPVDPYLRYGPKAEIAHIFRTPEKRPPQELSLAFLALVILPFLGFVVGLLRLGVNLKNFPTSTVPATFAILFQLGIAAVLSLYVLFWLKLDLFTTLKALGFLGIFLMVVGHRTLSHLASTSTKLKSA
ncbi:dolichyl-diphosphooligosaccharide--protein glycosyltransferase subunit 2-like [Actinidia eriantha]|uniref:dolichyl-diphosphooligosaccharide--protein glycosyltransferase subunit 2-like n=1 Tax=Actinidia eriantha TaxID=165200 RepID=UPI002582E601|nr:dolichyl-diphosphooligosaccharide--protein glycosyltransferase subunit 2-like [Actinidia eriantha]XP_057480678.1 dolichyl-diphosphooligosaccharide--protein glycosyltransferase subunit 2-like [Actinidia eriantha]